MGQSHSITKACQKIGVKLSEELCAIQFDSSGTVSRFGEVEKGQFEPNPDIAGQGVIIAFMTMSCIVCSFGVIIAIIRAVSDYLWWQKKKRTNWCGCSEWIHDNFDDVVLSVADTQLAVTLAFGVSFNFAAQCRVSTYHYMVALHLGVMGLATSSLAYFLVRNFSERYITALLRIGVFIHCVFLLIKRGWAVDGRLPGERQTDTMLILPAFCFLEGSFSPLRDLKPEARQYLSHYGLPREFRVQVSAITIAIGFRVALFLANICCLGTQRSMLQMPNLEKLSKLRLLKGYFPLIFYRLMVWVGWNLTIAWNWVTIYRLRDWVDRSDWLKRSGETNPEYDTQGLSQVAPLIALIFITAAIANGVSEAITKQWFPNYVSSKAVEEKHPETISSMASLPNPCPPRS